MSTSVTELAQTLQSLLIEDADQLGRASGFIRRQRKFNGASFAQTLVFGWKANPTASLEELCQSACACGVTISPQGLQERLNSPQANRFLHDLLLRSLEYLVEGKAADSALLRRFTGVYLQDSSKIQLPQGLRDLWSGHGQGQEAILKLQTVFDYQRGRLELVLAAGCQHDCPLQKTELAAGSLRLADLAYFKIKVFEELNQRGVYWLSRLPVRAGIWSGQRVIHVLEWLKQQASAGIDCIDQMVQLTAQQFNCRLIALRVPQAVAEARRQRVREAAKARKKSQLKEQTLSLCDWTILVTNLEPSAFSVQEALRLLRLRWQIELLFKLWKQHLSLDEWRSKQPFQIMSEVYAKLLLALIQHWLLILGCWQEDDRSLVKACLVLQKHAFHILSALNQLTLLFSVLKTVLPTLARCKVHRRKTRPATFQLLDLAYSLS